ncbi:type IV secretion system protein VirB8 [Bordetella ansorpii]|uniref:Type IV secretion system protein VirB8 n=1 Tax=Bordetella ansorpii TaxID=288768 RepID=A0A157SS94_9BORD|nr:type IV secretion system protein [Bordetella ansorpii]SAI73171.1 type IV secretion system protein VirB8 [Bordetella ansorpii]
MTLPEDTDETGAPSPVMDFEAPVSRDQLATELERVRGHERDWVHELLASRKRAWQTAYAAFTLAGLAIVAVAGLTPLKEPPELRVVGVDSVTGAVAHLTRLREAPEDFGERIGRYFVTQYVRACESYEWNTIQLHYDTCALFSTPDVQRAYYRRFEGANALDKRLGDRARINVDIRSITLGPNQTAVVRFSSQEHVNGGTNPPPRHRIATLAYRYVDEPLTEAVARANPLGFQVVSYAVDDETGS